jgi:glutamine phosphoribosylpyrophosphate amidotransferase
MEFFNDRSDSELLRSILAETAKATNEVKCAKADLEKANNRLSFVVMLTNTILKRSKGE